MCILLTMLGRFNQLCVLLCQLSFQREISCDSSLLHILMKEGLIPWWLASSTTTPPAISSPFDTANREISSESWLGWLSNHHAGAKLTMTHIYSRMGDPLECASTSCYPLNKPFAISMSLRRFGKEVGEPGLSKLLVGGSSKPVELEMVDEHWVSTIL